jgi:hypothetical protein
MKIALPIIVLACISCTNHTTSAKKAAALAYTVKPLTALAVDTSRSAERSSGQAAVFTTDLNNDQIVDTITLTSSTGDTATFDGISISLAHFKKQTFYTSTPWASVDDRFLDSNRNYLQTRKFFLAKGNLQSVLLLFGDLDGAGYREDFSIINIENNTAKLVLDQNQRKLFIESPLFLKDINADGRLDFVYRQIFEFNGEPDTLNGKIGTYSPYFVYTVDGNCVLNKPLTKHYNEDNYVFAGLKYDEGIKVFYPNDNSKPKLWKH